MGGDSRACRNFNYESNHREKLRSFQNVKYFYDLIYVWIIIHHEHTSLKDFISRWPLDDITYRISKKGAVQLNPAQRTNKIILLQVEFCYSQYRK